MEIEDLGDVQIVRGEALEALTSTLVMEQQADAIVTSPPYADARDDVKNVTPAEFADWFTPYLEALRGWLRPGGGFMLNLGRRFEDGVESDYIERTLLRAQEVGWVRIDTVVWGKINGRAVNPYLTNKHEIVYWLTHGVRPLDAFRSYAEVRYPYPAETLLRYQRNWINGTNVKGEAVIQEGRKPHPDGARPGSIYVTQVGKEKGIEHPTPMALDLARFLVCLSSPPVVCEFCGPFERVGRGGGLVAGSSLVCPHSPTRWRPGLVLDPFGGAGTTAVAAREHGRKCILIEREDKHADEACSRLAQGTLV